MGAGGLVLLPGHRVVIARGSEARSWLGDLLTSDVDGIPAGAGGTSLLLGPTGRIRAIVRVAATADGIALVQDLDQPEPIDEMLSPYVLSSDVALEDDTGSWALAWDPTGAAPHDHDAVRIEPSALGEGADLLVRPSLLEHPVRPMEGALESIRIRRGLARFPRDLTPESLPHEALFPGAFDDTKGCYLGQEAVARVRNLGHPQRLVLHVRAEADLAAGESLFDPGGAEIGVVTSAQPGADGHAIARIRWRDRDRRMRTGDSREIEVLGPATGAP